MQITLISYISVVGATVVSSRPLRLQSSNFVSRQTESIEVGLKAHVATLASLHALPLQNINKKVGPDHPATGSAVNVFSHPKECQSPAIRVEWRRMSPDDRDTFLSAVVCLIKERKSGGSTYGTSQNRYEDLVAVHQILSPHIHGTASFLPYHRYMLHVYEDLLKTECGYAGALPWWDETLDAGNFAASPIYGDHGFGEANLITPDFKAQCVQTGPFANTTLHVGPGDTNRDHCLERAIIERDTAQISLVAVNQCLGGAGYVDMWRCAEATPHINGHAGIGPTMSDVVSSPGDPLFYMHHAFIDRIWRVWQTADPEARSYQLQGNTSAGEPGTLDDVLSTLEIRPNVTIRDVMDTRGGYLCYQYDVDESI